LAGSQRELEQIQPQFRAHPAVLELRYKIHAEAKRWELAMAAAKEVRQLLPTNRGTFLHRFRPA